MARRLKRAARGGMAADHRAEPQGSLDAEIIIANAPDPVFVSDLEGMILQADDAVSALLAFDPTSCSSSRSRASSALKRSANSRPH